MSFLLDTNAISEPGRKAPDSRFMAWWAEISDEQMFLSALTLGELRRGIALLPQDERRSRLERFNTALRLRFVDQILPIDDRIAETWGELSARLKQAGRPAGLADELIAATALTHGLTLVTRNRRHFIETGCKLLSPWTGEDDI